MWNRELKHTQNGAYLKIVTYLRIRIGSNDISMKDIILLSPIKNGSMSIV